MTKRKKEHELTRKKHKSIQIGDVFGLLTVVDKNHALKRERQSHDSFYECKCQCGKTTYVVGNSLSVGSTKSCGCRGVSRGRLLEREKDLIYLAYPLCSTREIGEYINRRPYTIKKYAKDMGLSRSFGISVGDKFGRWTAIKEVEKPQHIKHGKHFWECRCDCANQTVKVVRDTALLSGDSTSCGCKSIESTATGYGNISGRFWNSMVSGAKYRNIEIKISIEYLDNLLIEQNFKCALTGLPLHIRKAGLKGKITTASIDRIDSTIGYEDGNLQFVHKDVNIMKHSYNQEYFIELCKLVVANATLQENILEV